MIRRMCSAGTVFPACAGMFLKLRAMRYGRPRFPRMRGDVPCDDRFCLRSHQFSPHARGCSFKRDRVGVIGGVFPACAGMFLLMRAMKNPGHSFPRMRGDVPTLGDAINWAWKFSPHARGCSDDSKNCGCAQPVFPACAGMFLCFLAEKLTSMSFPRMRGDVPADRIAVPASEPFSPHARGCSRLRNALRGAPAVFPACAGMFLTGWDLWSPTSCFPRMRGDVP